MIFSSCPGSLKTPCSGKRSRYVTANRCSASYAPGALSTPPSGKPHDKTPIPAGWDFLQAAATPEVYFTAYDALFNRGSLQMGERVQVHAAGSGVGTAAVQLAHHAGAFVIGTAGSAAKLAGAAELGINVGIN